MNIKVKKQEGVGFKGIWKFTKREAIDCQEHGGYGICECGAIKSIQEYDNIIPTVGRSILVEGLSGGLSDISDLEINFTSLGTGSTAPANGDTTLETETFRKAVASATFDSNQLFITAFYTAPEVSGTFAEAGVHIKGTASPDTGTLFSRVAIDVTKAVTETLTIDYITTLT